MAADGSNWVGSGTATLTLHLGVIDTPYAQKPQDANAPRAKAPTLRKDGQPSKARPRKHGPWQPGTHTESGEETTGLVAQWLEGKYHVMERFFELHGDEVANELGESVADAIDRVVQTSEAPEHIFPQEGLPGAQKLFNQFIDQKEMNYFTGGVPTKASLIGINSRTKGTLTPGRPSFRDTGNYEQAFRAWID